MYDFVVNTVPADGPPLLSAGYSAGTVMTKVWFHIDTGLALEELIISHCRFYLSPFTIIPHNQIHGVPDLVEMGN